MVVLPLASHLNPALAIGGALVSAGHEVAWCGPETDLRPLVGAGPVVYPTGKRLYRLNSTVGLQAIEKLWDGYLIPFNRFILKAADRAITEWEPDVVVVDQYAVAAGLAAHLRGTRWATLATGALELTPPTDELPGLDDLVQSRLAQVWAMQDLPADSGLDLRFSPQLVVALTTTALTGSAPLPEQCLLVGPALGARPTDPPFEWDRWIPDRRHVLVTVGTLLGHMASDFYARAAQAVEMAGSRVQAVFVVDPEVLPKPPRDAIVSARVPLLDLLPRLDAVICHGGLGTVTETLAHGVPLVVTPIRHDQPVVARQVEAAGAGIEVSFASASAEQLAGALDAVLDAHSYRDRARRVGSSFAAAGGARAAARHLAALASTSEP